MLRNILLAAIRQGRRSFAWWSAGLTILTLITLLFYPAIKDQKEFDSLLEERAETLAAFTGEVTSLTSPEGYLTSQLFFLMVPLLFIVFAVGVGARAIAGEEERGTLSLLLSTPVSRTRLVVEKWLSLALSSFLLAVVFLVVTIIGIEMVQMEIDLGRVGAATAMAWLIGLLFGSLALLIGALTGKRAVALGVTGAIAVGSYVLNALAPSVDALESWRGASAFYYYAKPDPITSGIDGSNALVLAVVACIFLPVAVVVFRRRDIST